MLTHRFRQPDSRNPKIRQGVSLNIHVRDSPRISGWISMDASRMGMIGMLGLLS